MLSHYSHSIKTLYYFLVISLTSFLLCMKANYMGVWLTSLPFFLYVFSLFISSTALPVYGNSFHETKRNHKATCGGASSFY